MLQKHKIRQVARELRLSLHHRRYADSNQCFIENFCNGPLETLKQALGGTIAGYWPVGSELDSRPLMQHLQVEGYTLCLPVTGDSGQPLVFRNWMSGDHLIRDRMGIECPPSSSPPMVPDLLIVPMVAFDRTGNRLGQGGGHYDRTLAALRATRKIIAVGVAYAGQELETIMPEPHDVPMDWLVTPQYALRTGRLA